MGFNQMSTGIATVYQAAWPRHRARMAAQGLALTLVSVLMAGCAQDIPSTSAPPVDGAAAPAPAALVVAPPPPPMARTADQFDTTTAEQRAAAVATPTAATAERLGTTIASLGPPAQAGLWLRTGLVDEVTMGRVEYPANGKSVALELRPSGGAASSGSQISLAALRLLGAPLTGLPQLVVYRD